MLEMKEYSMDAIKSESPSSGQHKGKADNHLFF